MEVTDIRLSLDQQQRYEFRRTVRSFVRWFNYINQVVRSFDIKMHDEFTFCRYLLHLLPPDQKDNWDLDNKVRLEYYKLQHTFSGSIELDKGTAGEYETAKIKKSGSMKEVKTPFAKEAGAVRKIKGVCLVNLEVLNQYIEDMYS